MKSLAHMQLMCRDSDVGRRISHPDIAKAIFMPLMMRDRETLCVMGLDESRKVINAIVAAIGTVDMVQCHPCDVFRPALQMGATYILLAHNHPSGDPTPSSADLETTKNLEIGAKILQIGFVDHLVLTASGKYTSIAEYVETRQR